MITGNIYFRNVNSFTKVTRSLQNSDLQLLHIDIQKKYKELVSYVLNRKNLSGEL